MINLKEELLLLLASHKLTQDDIKAADISYIADEHIIHHYKSSYVYADDFLNSIDKEESRKSLSGHVWLRNGEHWTKTNDSSKWSLLAKPVRIPIYLE